MCYKATGRVKPNLKLTQDKTMPVKCTQKLKNNAIKLSVNGALAYIGDAL